MRLSSFSERLSSRGAAHASPLSGTIERSDNRDPHHQVVRPIRNAAQMAHPKFGVGPVSTAVFLSEQPLTNRSRMPLGGEPKPCVADVLMSESHARWIYSSSKAWLEEQQDNSSLLSFRDQVHISRHKSFPPCRNKR